MSQEIEFVLSPLQYELMGYPGLRQGQFLTLQLDGGILLPDANAESWFAVQRDPVPECCIHVGPGLYAYGGQIVEADLDGKESQAELETATLLVRCGAFLIRVTCAPGADGRLPYGTWETRYLTGHGPIQGIVEDDYRAPIGHPQSLTIWGFRRLVLTPGDPCFGEWRESEELLPTPYLYDRVVVVARLHREII